MLYNPIELDKKIFELREQGLIYEKIVQQLALEGIKISLSAVQKRCKRIYIEKNMEEPKVKRAGEIEVSNERIFDLREQGLSHKKIAQQLEKEGIKTTEQTIRDRCKRIYAKKNMKEPKAKREQKIKVSDERIFELRQQGVTYAKISQQLAVEGIKISLHTIRKICKRIYAEKNMVEPQLKIEVSDERIFELRQQKLTYKKMMQQLRKEGIKITETTIRSRCKRIYAEKNMEEPKAKIEPKVEVSDEIIFELREQGLTHKKIAQQFRAEGIEVTTQAIQQRCKRIYDEKNMTQPKAKKEVKIDVLNERIFELRQQELSYKAIAQQLRVEGINISETAIQCRCKKIYTEKNMEESKVKIEISDQRIFELRQQGLTYKKIVQQLETEGIKVSWTTIYKRCKRIYAEKNMEEPKVKRGRHKKVNHKKTRIDISKMDPERILHIFKNIEHRKKATKAQLQELAEFYGIDYSKLKERNEKIRY